MAEYITYRPKKVLNVHKHVDGWFWLKYTADPYIGCEHGCEYYYKLFRSVRELCRKHGLPDRMPRPVDFFPKHLRLNKRIAEHEHNRAYEIQQEEGNSYRFWAHLKAAWTVDELNHDVHQFDNLADLPNIGPKIAAEIKEKFML